MLCWEDGSEELRSRSACRRRKTILIFDDDEDGRLVGFAAWRLLGTDVPIDGQLVGEIRFIGVVPDREREGIGRQLIAQCVDALIGAHGSNQLTISAEVDAENYNAANAFEHGAGFEHYASLESGFEMLILPLTEESPFVDDAGLGDEGADTGPARP
jgi:ribosomal protein S18 acetylase RimI-like enzyme